MSRPIIRIHNVETDQVIDREMTAAEYKEYEADKAAQAIAEAKEAAKATNKADLLTKLGITAEEAQLLLS